MTIARGGFVEKAPMALSLRCRASLALPLELRRLDRLRAAVRRKRAVQALYRAAWRERHPWLARAARREGPAARP